MKKFVVLMMLVAFANISKVIASEKRILPNRKKLKFIQRILLVLNMKEVLTTSQLKLFYIQKTV